MRMFLKVAAVSAALALFVSAAAEAQGDRGGRGQGRGGGRGGPSNTLSAEGVSADSAYSIMMAGITLDATKKAAVVQLITKWQTDMRANPAPAFGGGGRRGGDAGGGVAGGGRAGMDSATLAAMTAAQTKRVEITNSFRTELKKQLTEAQAATFDATFPPAALGGRRGGGNPGGV